MDILFETESGLKKLDILARRPDIRLSIDGHALSLSELPAEPGRIRLQSQGRTIDGWRYVSGNEVFVHLGGRHWSFRRSGIEAGESAGGTARAEVRAEMPGTVVSLHVSAGMVVAEGDRLLTIESMKLQMILTAHRAGEIATVHVGENATFERGATLVSFAPDGRSDDAHGPGKA